MRPAPGLVLLGLATASCAQILGLDDPAGRLGEGGAGSTASTGTDATSTGTGTGTGGSGAGGEPGAGGGSPPATSTGSSTGTGGGGGSSGPGARELPAGFAIHALGRSDDGGVALLRWTGGVGVELCGAPVLPQHLAAVAMEGAECEVLTTLSGADPQGLAIEQRGAWLGFVATDGPTTATLHTGVEVAEETDVDGAGFYALWEVGSATGLLLATAAPLLGGHLGPRPDGSALLLKNTDQFGFDPGRADPCDTAAAGGAVALHWRTIEADPFACSRPRLAVDGSMLDVAAGNLTWALTRSVENCSAIPHDGSSALALGSCGAPGHLLVDGSGGGDIVYLGAAVSGPCSSEAGLIRNFGDGADALWCDAADGDTVRVIPFLVDATHAHFVRVTGAGAELWRASLEGSLPELVRELCTGCAIRDAVASNGTLYLVGATEVTTTLFGQTISGPRELWGWSPLDEL